MTMILGVKGSRTVSWEDVGSFFGTIFGGHGRHGGAAPVNIMASSKAMVATARAVDSRVVGGVAAGGTGCTTPEPLPRWSTPSVGISTAPKLEAEAMRLK